MGVTETERCDALYAALWLEDMAREVDVLLGDGVFESRQGREWAQAFRDGLRRQAKGFEGSRGFAQEGVDA